MARVILEKLGEAQVPEWILLILHGHSKKDTFLSHAPNLNPNKKVKDNFGKVGNRFRGLTAHCWFFTTLAKGTHFQLRVPT